ncbi:unnamed protein product [Amoebophrya sp. A120]|nr:unnamed protein product [Amoebophrya sp. A120]|eukprot:GSA120T00008553001.1
MGGTYSESSPQQNENNMGAPETTTKNASGSSGGAIIGGAPAPAASSSSGDNNNYLNKQTDEDHDTRKFVEQCLATKMQELLDYEPTLENAFGTNTPCTDVEKSKVICVRHAISCANYAQMASKLPKFFDKYKLRKQEPFESFEQRMTVKIGTARSLVDCPLHPYGVLQTEKRAHLLANVDFHTVFVSPLRRTLQTCNSLFKNHPGREKIKFVVLPMIREWVRYTDGIPCDYAQRLKFLFSSKTKNQCDLDFDFSLLEEDLLEKNYWILRSLLNGEKREMLEKEIVNKKRHESALQEFEDPDCNSNGTSAGPGSPAPAGIFSATTPTAAGADYEKNANGKESTVLYGFRKEDDCAIKPDLSNVKHFTDTTLQDNVLANTFLQETKKVVPHPFEDYFDTMKRAEKTKEFLSEYMAKFEATVNFQEQKIGIVAHYRFLDAFFALDGKNKRSVKVSPVHLQGGRSFANCEIAGWNM